MANLTNNDNTTGTTTGEHSLTALLSLPMDFSIDPLMTFQNTTTLSNNEALFPLTSELIPMMTSDGSSISSSPSMTSFTGSPSNNTLSSPTMKKKVCNKNNSGTKKARLSLEDKDQKTKERILRNRAAAQESRDRKRKYVADLEESNKKLTTENEFMNKRMKLLEFENQQLQQQLAAFAQQLAQLHQQKSSSSSTSLFSHGFCDSARIVIKGLFFFNL